jgi:acetylornithine deacetylase
MNSSEILDFTAKLISFKSLSGSEGEVINFLKDNFDARGWSSELLPVEENRFNIFVTFGKPTIMFSTHLDVVPAKDHLFNPVFRDNRLFGRGACDAKGIAATMIAVAESLLKDGETDFGLLFVVGEELDGSGAKAAAIKLQGRGIKFIINGEPTEGKIMRAHKGVLGLEVAVKGRACHSGYPHLGEDANAKLVRIGAKMLQKKWPQDDLLGETTVNIGVIQGGLAGNIVSPSAKANILFRTVTPTKELLDGVNDCLESGSSLRVTYEAPAVRLLDIDGLQTDVASYCTDIPNFAPLKAECVLYGPGTIHLAHTDEESISLHDIEDAFRGYRLIFHQLKARHQK